MDAAGPPICREGGSEGFAETIALLERHDEGPRCRTQVGFGPDSCTPALLRAVEAKARELNTVVAIHAAQKLHETGLVKERHGTRSIPLLPALGLLHNGVILAHDMFAEDDELALVAPSDAALAACRPPFARSGQFVPRARFETSGLRLGIGTDGVHARHVDGEPYRRRLCRGAVGAGARAVGTVRAADGGARRGARARPR